MDNNGIIFVGTGDAEYSAKQATAFFISVGGNASYITSIHEAIHKLINDEVSMVIAYASDEALAILSNYDKVFPDSRMVYLFATSQYPDRPDVVCIPHTIALIELLETVKNEFILHHREFIVTPPKFNQTKII